MDRELENLSNEKLYEKYDECISNIYNTNDDVIKDENKKIIFRNQPIKNLSSYFIKHLNVNDTISIMGNKSSQYKNENELVGFSPINVRLIKADEKRNFYNYDYKILIFNITNNIKFLIYRIVIGLKSLFGISQNY